MGKTVNTTGAVSRVDLMGGRLWTAKAPQRPPWALPEPAFLDICTGCDACIDACPTSILKQARGGYPVVDFACGECTFCGDCVSACRPRALRNAGSTPPWTLLATVASGCLSATGTMCRMCGDRCEAGAITFKLALGGRASPIIDPAHCTGCGACVAPCPVNAIDIMSETMISETRGR